TILSTEANIYLLTVTDTTNCKSSQRVVVDEYCSLLLYVPNAFSPNGDGTNDEFKISIHPSRIQNFEVYNRWGQLIEQNQTGTWSGKDAQTDVYVIILTYTDDNGNAKRYWGNVTLLR
ncbi:MAG: gliding motility-associated C-terminal domain-containing protein, partial [Bacteroidia bacterium]|nr:gliding motility-associated C-terminal domain-containing protein [Bacteroidia bacterium]